MYGECDDGESYMPCEVFYAMTFGVGFAAGAVMGGLVAAARN